VKGQTRRRLLLGLTLAVILWPLAHLALVSRMQIDAWELFGWAMYSRPDARVQVRVDVERGGVLTPLRAMGPLRRAVERHARRRTTLGRLASPDALLAAVFASDPSIEAVEIVQRTIELDRETARLVAYDEHERSPRPGSGADATRNP
jgi:hypothetical protein